MDFTLCVGSVTSVGDTQYHLAVYSKRTLNLSLGVKRHL